MKLSNILGLLTIGNPASAAPVATMRNVTINDLNGTITYAAGPDVAITNTAGTTVGGAFSARKVWNAVWNDYADFQKLDDKLIAGKCYVETKTGAKIAVERCQMGLAGIATDTFGMAVGQGVNPTEVPLAVAGWVLAYVDKEYASGTALTCDAQGNLTEMSLEEKRSFPERIMAIYKRPEPNKEFGDEVTKIAVNGRHWVKVF
jgi:hypothetical protein